MKTEKNQIQLNRNIISQLYKNVLVEEKIPDATAKKSDKNHHEDLLKKANEILIFVKSTQEKTGAKQLDFLHAILDACKIDRNKVDILNSFQTGQIFKKNQVKKCILFGLPPEQLNLPFKFPYFQLQEFEGCTYLIAPPLEELENDKIKKKELWVCLQKMFQL